MKNITNWFGLEHTLCVVAGSEGLIGNACTNALLDCGAKVMALDLAPKSKTNREGFQYFQADITEEKLPTAVLNEWKTKASAKEVKEVFFFNISYPRTEGWKGLDFENVSKKELDKNLEIHLGSSFRFSQLAVQFFKEVKKSGGIINFSSIYGSHGPDLSIYLGTEMKNAAPYAAIKSGITGFTRYIATAYGDKNIRANIISPGGVEDKQPASFIEAYSKRTPLGRMAQPDDIAGLCIYLASPAAKYITGQNIHADGGWSAW